MPLPPAVVIVVRHGQRLDAANSDWHLTSPAPYDPPLTYGGWLQSKLLGGRIASILHSLSVDGDFVQTRRNGANSSCPTSELKTGQIRDVDTQAIETEANPRLRRRFNVVMHSSPFLRCIQTSIAISAGMAQSRCPSKTVKLRLSSPNERLRSPHNVQLAVPSDTNGQRTSHSDKSARATRSKLGHFTAECPWNKPTLRIDASLGEWLSPEYYELITPPPPSSLMMGAAKAELRRKGDPVELADATAASRGNFPGGWTRAHSQTLPSSPLSPNTPTAETFDPFASFKSPSPEQHKGTSSHPESDSPKDSPADLTQSRTLTAGDSFECYKPPVPGFAVSPAGPIPQGYVSHAKDACIDVDYSWDTTREPLDWGDGGDYGEEWSSMHKRFRRSLSSLISWYASHPRDAHWDDSEHSCSSTEDVDETAIIIVTHGAGCNALLGALTSQPILVNVDLSSLSMAIRRPDADVSTALDRRFSVSTDDSGRRRSSLTIDGGWPQVYEMRLFASTDHLLLLSDGATLQKPLSRPNQPDHRRPLDKTNGPSIAVLKRSDRRYTTTNAGPMAPKTLPTPILKIKTQAKTSTGLWSSPVSAQHRSHSSSSTTWSSATEPAADKESVSPPSTANSSKRAGAVRFSESMAQDDSAVVDSPAPTLWTPSGNPSALWRPVTTAAAASDEPVRDQTGKRRWTMNHADA